MIDQPQILADDCHITDETHDFLADHGLEVRDLIYTDACKTHCFKVLCQKPQASPIEAPSKDHQSPLEAPLDCASAKELEAADPAVEAVREIMHKLSTFAQIDVERAAIEAKIRAEGRAPEGSAFTGEIGEFAGTGWAPKEYVHDVENQIRDLQQALAFTLLRLIERLPEAKSIHPDDLAWSERGKIGDEHWFDAVARLMGKDHLHPDTLALIQVLNNDARRALEEIK